MKGKDKDCKRELKKIKKKLKKKSYAERAECIAICYKSKSEEDKYAVITFMKNFIQDFDKVSLISIALAFIPILLKELCEGSALIITCSIMYFALGWFISKKINIYCFYKFYLDVIEDMRHSKIVIVTKQIETIEFRNY